MLLTIFRCGDDAAFNKLSQKRLPLSPGKLSLERLFGTGLRISWIIFADSLLRRKKSRSPTRRRSDTRYP